MCAQPYIKFIIFLIYGPTYVVTLYMHLILSQMAKLGFQNTTLDSYLAI